MSWAALGRGGRGCRLSLSGRRPRAFVAKRIVTGGKIGLWASGGKAQFHHRVVGVGALARPAPERTVESLHGGAPDEVRLVQEVQERGLFQRAAAPDRGREHEAFTAEVASRLQRAHGGVLERHRVRVLAQRMPRAHARLNARERHVTDFIFARPHSATMSWTIEIAEEFEPE